jgi:hypothetical protein
MFTRRKHDILLSFASEIGCIYIQSVHKECSANDTVFQIGQNCREMKIEISVKLLLLVCPILELPMKFSMTRDFSINPRYKFRNSVCCVDMSMHCIMNNHPQGFVLVKDMPV